MPGGQKQRSTPFSANVAAILNDARLEQLKTQSQLASEVGVSPAQMGRYLRGDSAPTIIELHDMCAVLGLSIVGVISDALRNL